MTRRLLFRVPVLLMALALFPAQGYCFEPGLTWGSGDWLIETQPTHPRMSLNAAGVIEHRYTPDQVELFAAGSRDEDRFALLPPASKTRTWHGYNPATREGFWNSPTDTVPEGAELLYKEALAAFARGWGDSSENDAEDESAFHLLGRAAHLLQDVVSVAHVHLDNHGLDPDHFPYFFGLDDFESYAAEAFASEEQVGPREAVIPDPSLPVRELAARLAGLTYSVSAWPGLLRAQVWDPGHGDFGSMFPELTYLESGFWGDGVFRIPGVGTYDPEETLIELNAWFATPETVEVQRDSRGEVSRVAGEFYVQDAVEAVPALFRDHLGRWSPNPEGAVLVELWGRDLFPLAVGYTAALLLKFQEEAGLAGPAQAEAR